MINSSAAVSHLPCPRGRASLIEAPPDLPSHNESGPNIHCTALERDATQTEPSDSPCSIPDLRFKLHLVLTQAVTTGRLDSLVESALAPEKPVVEVGGMMPALVPTWDEAFTFSGDDTPLAPVECKTFASTLAWDEAYTLPEEFHQKSTGSTCDVGGRSIQELKSCLSMNLRSAVETGSLASMMENALGNHDGGGEVQRDQFETPAAPAQDVVALIELVQLVCARDRRIGELVFSVTETERLLAERDVQRRYLENALCTANQDLAHLDLDVLSQKQALQGVNNHFGEMLEAVVKSKGKNFQALRNPCPDTVRSDVSTSASGASVITNISNGTVGSSQNRSFTLF